MSAYQKLKEFQDEVERETGFRPYVQVNFHANTQGIPEGKSALIRDYFAEPSDGVLKPVDQSLEMECGQIEWVCYQANGVGISISVHGLNREKEDVTDNEDSVQGHPVSE